MQKNESALKVVVITGSTQGIGYGLADAFLERGCAVVVSGRTAEKVDAAVERLSAQFGRERVIGRPCDVRHISDVQALWDAAEAHFGRVDIWINNAGIANHPRPLWEIPQDEVDAVLDTNLLGTVNGSQTAIKSMLKQGFGALYNMEGMGSDGRRRSHRLTLYGSTKAAIRFVDVSLADEVSGTPVIVGALRPGMVATEMLSKPYENRPEEWERAKRIFNILADRVEDVSPWLADRVLQNQRNGALISYTSSGKILGRFLMAPFRKRKVF